MIPEIIDLRYRNFARILDLGRPVEPAPRHLQGGDSLADEVRPDLVIYMEPDRQPHNASRG